MTHQFLDAIRAAGIEPPDEIIADGKIHRFASSSKRNDDAGWYVYHDDDIPAGMFGDWRTGIKQSWQADIHRKMTDSETAAHLSKLQAMQRERQADESRRRAEARQKATTIWNAAQPAPGNHPYLVAKRVKPNGARIHRGSLVIAIHDNAGVLHSLQFIDDSGAKRFLTGGRIAGCYFIIGNLNDTTVCIAEGFATGATIHEATGYPVSVAFNAGNLHPVARTLRGELPNIELIICADDDVNTAGNPGVTKAKAAALAVNGKLAIPHFGSDRPTGVSDFNDLAKLYGPEAVKRCIDNAEEPEFVSAPREKKRAERNFELQTWGDFVATDHGNAPFTIEGIAPDAGLIAFHGRGKGGKTTLLIHASRAIATGALFLGRPTAQKPIVYINYEMGFAYLKQLLVAGGPCPNNAFVVNRPTPILGMAEIETVINNIGKPGVVIIDSFRGAFRLGGDAENSAGGAGLILRNLQDLAVIHRWLVIVVHHSNRSAREGTDGVSGTSDWIAAPDVIWTWQRPDKNKPGVLSIEGRMAPVEPLAVDLTPEKCVFVGSVEASQEETDNRAILQALTEEGQKSDVIAEAIGRPAGTVRKRLEALFTKELVKRAGEGKKNDPYLYSKICFRTENPLGAETNFEFGVTGVSGEQGGGEYI